MKKFRKQSRAGAFETRRAPRQGGQEISGRMSSQSARLSFGWPGQELI
ncbi:hypothetical protein SLI_6709 [Streptomyces lividans 1326]|uniref:Uncharacterized protein n=1 Tax=Streptomyces lividans 1326 TaxID=1200984 RepID=A0A7U9HEC5_STRLI|nr:hypothetical protein SLI_6709 [Streptomyces lividans 1326]